MYMYGSIGQSPIEPYIYIPVILSTEPNTLSKNPNILSFDRILDFLTE